MLFFPSQAHCFGGSWLYKLNFVSASFHSPNFAVVVKCLVEILIKVEELQIFALGFNCVVFMRKVRKVWIGHSPIFIKAAYLNETT